MVSRIAPIILIAGFALRLVIIAVKPEVLWIDDTFYSLGVARNIAGGMGWTHDGFQLTNGFQPLYVFLMIPFYLVLPTDGFLIPTIAIVLQAVLNMLTGWLLFRLIHDRISPPGALLALVIWSFSPYVVSGVNGLETPLTTFLIMVTFYLYITRWRDELDIRRALLLGLLAGLTILSRIDAVFFALPLLLDILRRWRWRAIRPLIPIGAMIGLCLGAWLTLSYLNTGQLNFDSGSATRLRSIALYDGPQIFYTHFALVRTTLNDWLLTPVFPWLIPVGGMLILPLTIFVVFAVVLWQWRKVSRPDRRALRTMLGELTPMWLYALVLIAAYVLYQFTYWNWERYFYSLTLVVLLLLAIGIRVVQPSPRLLGVVIAGYLLLLPFSLPRDLNPILMTPAEGLLTPHYAAADWLNANMPPEAVGAAYQSGILGYFTTLPVINLDGVVNAEALPYYLEDRIEDYLHARDIDFFVDWRLFADHLDLPTAQMIHTQQNNGREFDVTVLLLNHEMVRATPGPG